MECNATSLTKRRRTSGVTLIEVLIGMGISGMLLSALAAFIFFSGKSFAAIFNYADLDRQSRNALDEMIYKVRQADELVSFQPHEVVFSVYGTNELRYKYSSEEKTLLETFQGLEKVLLTECDDFAFSMFQRNSEEGTYDQFPATLTNNVAKLIQVNWTCSRKILGARVNTESVQSAKVVLRNQ